MGGDFGAVPNVAGAKLALAEFSRIDTLFLVGDEAALKAEMQKAGLHDPRIEIVHASEVVEMSDSAVSAIRKKKDSSISVATELVKSGRAQAVISAGHTGAAVAAATLKLRTLPGVDRAGIASPMPNLHGTCHLIDAGANVDSKPLQLLQQAIMGSVWAKYADGIDGPVVGLMSNGEEDSKGNEVTKEVFDLLRACPVVNFKGNIEGRDILNAPVNVAVCDGFVGNVLLKGCEGTGKAMLKYIRSSITATPWRKFLAALLKPALKEAANKLNYEVYGGSPLLGVNGTVIIAHGSSSALAIKNALRVGMESIQHAVNAHIVDAVAKGMAGIARDASRDAAAVSARNGGE